jgi:hypothetical protein
MKQTLFPERETAAALAASHAKLNFPKRVALGRFSGYAWTGGEAYREWLITLPHYPASYLSGHFEIRNVLVHVRCDVRDGADGERVLLVAGGAERLGTKVHAEQLRVATWSLVMMGAHRF